MTTMELNAMRGELYKFPVSVSSMSKRKVILLWLFSIDLLVLQHKTTK
jgi:hypothetical protein